jgi:hypothetical protein
MLASGYTLTETTTLPFGEAVERVRADVASGVRGRLAAVVAPAAAP